MPRKLKRGDVCVAGKWVVTALSVRGATLCWGDTEVQLQTVGDVKPGDPAAIQWVVEDRCRLPARQATREELCREYGGSLDDYRGRSWAYDTPPELASEALHVIDHVCEKRKALVCREMGSAFRHTDQDQTGEEAALTAAWDAAAVAMVGLEPVNAPPEETATIGGASATIGPSEDCCAIVVRGGRPPTYELMPGARTTKTCVDEGTLWGVILRAEGGTLKPGGSNRHAPPMPGIAAAARDYLDRHRETLARARLAVQANRFRRDDHFDRRLNLYVRPKGGFKKKRIATSVDVQELRQP